MLSVSMVGIGRLGGALALALVKAGYHIENLIHRDATVATAIASRIPSAQLASFESFPKVRSDVVIVTTADPDIRPVAEQLSNVLDHKPVVLHTSGSLSYDVLSSLASVGCATGSMHPLVSVSEAISGAGNFANAYFCLEGDELALRTAGSIVDALGARSFAIPSEFKPLYHAAAVTAAGHVVALFDIAIEMLARTGVDRATANEVLVPLIKTTVANLALETPAKALTGSFARADVGAVARHLDLIDKTVSPAVREVYLLLGERSLDLAAANGANADDIRELRERIMIAKRKSE